MNILTINAGSSSLRLTVFSADQGGLRPVASAHPGTAEGPMESQLQQFIAAQHGIRIDAVAHRIVHGGARFSRPCRIDSAVETQLTQLIPLAPLHNAAALRLIRASRALFDARVAQIAVFDTGFYHDLPAVAARYALPTDLLVRHGLRRYGFHGLAHQALWQRWSAVQSPPIPDARVITLQLGSGASITAIRAGTPIDTSMGFTPLEGLMMATRCGDLDPGLLLHLQRELNISLDELDELLNRRSGLLGVSGLSADMRELLASDTAAAQLAVSMYCYRARKYIGAYMAALGGVDSIVFGGGVGENAPAIRARILADMAWAGIQLDAAANQGALAQEQIISSAVSRVSVWVIPADEQRLLAEHAMTALQADTAQ